MAAALLPMQNATRSYMWYYVLEEVPIYIGVHGRRTHGQWDTLKEKMIEKCIQSAIHWRARHRLARCARRQWDTLKKND